MWGIRCVICLFAVNLLLSGCSSKEMMTQSALGCSIRDLEIIPSEFERQGSRTNWCANVRENFLVYYECSQDLS